MENSSPVLPSEPLDTLTPVSQIASTSSPPTTNTAKKNPPKKPKTPRIQLTETQKSTIVNHIIENQEALFTNVTYGHKR